MTHVAIRVLRAVGVLGILCELPLMVLVGHATDHGARGTIFTIAAILAEVGPLGLGWLIIRRHHANRMGWLFIALALPGMADRLDAIGGSLRVRSALGAGTTVARHLPTGVLA